MRTLPRAPKLAELFTPPLSEVVRASSGLLSKRKGSGKVDSFAAHLGHVAHGASLPAYIEVSDVASAFRCSGKGVSFDHVLGA